MGNLLLALAHLFAPLIIVPLVLLVAGGLVGVAYCIEAQDTRKIHAEQAIEAHSVEIEAQDDGSYSVMDAPNSEKMGIHKSFSRYKLRPLTLLSKGLVILIIGYLLIDTFAPKNYAGQVWLNPLDPCVNLSGANLYRVKILGGNFNYARLSRADLTAVIIREVDFKHANFSQAVLKQSQLRDVMLDDANMQGADFSGARLEGVFVLGTDLRGANLNGAIYREVFYNEKTQWPANFNPHRPGIIFDPTKTS